MVHAMGLIWMPGKVRLPAPEVVSALLDVGHMFPPPPQAGVFVGHC